MKEKPKLDRRAFLKQYCLTEEQLKATGLQWPMLEAIYLKHAEAAPQLQKTADYVTERLREVAVVHSIKVRIKHPEHVIEKIIRKKIARAPEAVTTENYSDAITDLIGIRALHLFKGEWLPIHEFVTGNWDVAEKPIAYIREGDGEAVKKAFSDAGCEVTVHEFGYRSVHYLIKSHPTRQLHLAELQVRTLFEEAWSEIDHCIRYPQLSDNPYLSSFLNIFNRIAGSADEMGTFIQALGQYVRGQDEARTEAERQIKQMISDLKVSQAEKNALEKQLEELRRSSPSHLDTFSPVGTNISYLATIPSWVVGATNLTPSINYYGGILASTKTCSRCGRQYTDELLGAAIVSDRCPTCRLLP